MRRWIAPVIRSLAARCRTTSVPARHTARLALTEMERRDLLATLQVIPQNQYENDQPFGPGNGYYAAICIVVDNPPGDESDVTVNWQTVNGTASAGSDFTASSGTVTLSATYSSPNTYYGNYIFIPLVNDSVPEADETFTIRLSSPSSNATIAQADWTITILNDDSGSVSPLAGATVLAPCPTIDVVQAATGAAINLATQLARTFSAFPVRYADGAISYSADDLPGGLGTGWGLQRTWTNAPGYAVHPDAGNGSGFSHLPSLVQLAAGYDDALAVVSNGTTARTYDLIGGSYASRSSDQTVLTHDTTNHLFVLTDSTGAKTTFYDFSTSHAAGKRGRFAGYADPAGNAVGVVSSNGAGQPTEVQQSATAGGVTVTESYLFAYYTSGAGAGMMSSATLRRKVGAGAWATVRSVEYTYHDGTTSAGTAGDLATATVKDAAGNVVSSSYYRYYTSSSSTGYAGGLKYVVSGAGYDLAVAAVGALASATDNQLAPYAAHYFEYDSSKRVTKEVAGGLGCSACAGGLGEFTYTYTTSANGVGFNSWQTKTVETLPDGTTNTVYTNAFAQVMLTAVTTGGQTWVTYYQYDDAGRLVLTAAPSAVTGYSDTYSDLVHFTAGNAQYLSDGAGLVSAYTYASTTTATTSAAGDAAGYLKAAAIRRGETGTAVPQQALTYIKNTAGGIDFFQLASDTVYRNADGTGGQTTTYAYTYASGTNRVASVTTTLPAVTTAQNGPNAATAVVVTYDTYGRPVWTKDAAGFLTYTEYDTATGAVVKTIEDVDTTQTGTFAGLPSGWATPTGGGLHRTTTAEVDALGRPTKVTHPGGRVDYAVYNDAAHEARYYPAWNSTTNTPTGPTTVVRDDWARGYVETLTMSAAPAVSGGRPTGGEAVSAVQTLSRAYRNAAGQTVTSDAYFDLTGLTYTTSTSLGTSGTNFYRTTYGYDAAGRPNKVVSPQGTIYRTVYDGLGRAVGEYVGTDDTPTTGFWSPTNLTGTNTVQVRASEYDGGGVGDGNLTKTTEYPGLSAAARVTQTWFDWRNRAVATKGGVETTESGAVQRPLFYTDYDNLGQPTLLRRYVADGVTLTDANSDGVPDAPAAGNLRAQSAAEYDELGRVYRVKTFHVNPSSGAVSTNSLRTDTWYDARGNVVKTAEPGGLVTKAAYDGLGRVTVAYATDGGGDTGYADADDVTGDVVLEQVETSYDAAGRVIRTTTRQRHHDATGTGSLASGGGAARVYYAGYYYDPADRLVAAVDIGTSPGTVYAWPSTPPTSTDTVLVSSTSYDSAGRVYDVTDPAGRVTRTTYDALGRVTQTVQNYVNGVVSDADDKTTTFAYNAAGMTSLTAHLTGGGVQTTQWVYGVTSAGGSGLDSNDLVGATRWPDPTTGATSSSQQDAVTVNALGQTVTGTDRNGTTHTYTYDVLGRVTTDAVTTLGSGVDGAVRRIETAYGGQGQAYKVTSYNAASGGSVVNQVVRDFDGLGQLIAEWQAHAGAVSFSTSPKLQYTYSFSTGGTANHSRVTGMTYPGGYALSYTYASGVDAAVSRPSAIGDTAGLEGYQYLGLDTVVARTHSQPGIDLTYAKRTGESDGDAGDRYVGLDRFGRVADQRWVVAATGAATDRFQYGYDRAGNRTYRDNAVSAAFGEVYTYDGLDQVASFARGTLNGAKTGISGTASRTQAWDYDAVGNWDGINVDGTNQSRTANRQNEVTAVGGATTPGYDANGNMTQAETGLRYVYDAWNRLVAVKNAANTTTLETFGYDGLNRRVTATVSGTTTDLYYSAGWQVIEERVGGNVKVRHVWSPVYVDALVLRDRDTDANGSLDERLWVQQDANWNVTTVVDGTGAVVERYAYDPFGQVTVLDANWATDADGASDVGWVYGHQGLRYDATAGLYDNRFRWYSPTLGRFTSLDPLGYVAGDQNQYRYIGNAPMATVDPTGLQPPATRPQVTEVNGFFIDQSTNRCTGGYGRGPAFETNRPNDYFNPFKLPLAAILAPDTLTHPGSYRGGLSRMGELPPGYTPSGTSVPLPGEALLPGPRGLQLASSGLSATTRTATRVVLNSPGGTRTAPAVFVRRVARGERIPDLIAEGKSLTWVNEAEHAVLSVGERGAGRSQYVVVRGGRDGIEFIERNGELFFEMEGQLVKVKRVIGHTHPIATGPSAGDQEALRILGQTRSYIIEIGGETGGTLIRPTQGR